MSEIITQNAIMEVLDWTYDKALNGIPGFDSAEELAKDYLKNEGTLEENVNSLIRWQNTKCATSGFLTGIGGMITMPVAIPANISSVIYVQMRMVAAIAYMGGYDIREDKVKALVYTCLLGNVAKDVMKEVGIQVGKKLTESMIKRISGEVIKNINHKVGFRLFTKFGQKGVINLVKAIPIVSGFIGGTLDLVATNIIGDVARETFIG